MIARRLISFGLLGAIALAGGMWAGSREGSRAGGEGMAGAGALGETHGGPQPMAWKPAEVRDAAVERAARVTAGDVFSVLAEIDALTSAAEQNSAFLDLLAALDLAGMQQLMGLIGSESGIDDLNFDHLDDAAVLAIFDRWAELDTPGMLEAFRARILGESGGDDYFLEMGEDFLTFAIGLRDPKSALAFLDSLGEGGQEWVEDYGHMVHAGIAVGDPQEAMRELSQLLEAAEEISDIDYELVIEGMGGRAGEALEEALAIGDEEIRDTLVEELFETWSEFEPAAAYAAAVGLEDEELREWAVADALRGWAAHDPARAFAALQTLEPASQRRLELPMLESWAQADPRAAMEWARENERPEWLARMFDKASNDLPPAQAAEFYSSLEEGQRRVVSKNFVRRYLQQDPLAALHWLEEAGAETALSGVSSAGSDAGQALAMRGPEAIAEALNHAPAGQVGEQMIRTAFEHTGFNDAEAARDLLAAVPAGERSAAVAGMAMGMLENDPEAAASFARAESEGGVVDVVLMQWKDSAAGYRWLVAAEGDDADAFNATLERTRLVSAWAQQEPLAAAEAMLGLPDDLAAARMGDVVSEWAHGDQAAVAAFVGERLERGMIRDRAVAAMVSAIKDEDVNAAMAWAREIDDEALMYQTMDSLATE